MQRRTDLIVLIEHNPRGKFSLHAPGLDAHPRSSNALGFCLELFTVHSKVAQHRFCMCLELFIVHSNIGTANELAHVEAMGSGEPALLAACRCAHQ